MAWCRTPPCIQHTTFLSTTRRPSHGDHDHIWQTVPGLSTGSKCHGCCRRVGGGSVLGGVHQRTVIPSRVSRGRTLGNSGDVRLWRHRATGGARQWRADQRDPGSRERGLWSLEPEIVINTRTQGGDTATLWHQDRKQIADTGEKLNWLEAGHQQSPRCVTLTWLLVNLAWVGGNTSTYSSKTFSSLVMQQNILDYRNTDIHSNRKI